MTLYKNLLHLILQFRNNDLIVCPLQLFRKHSLLFQIFNCYYTFQHSSNRNALKGSDLFLFTTFLLFIHTHTYRHTCMRVCMLQFSHSVMSDSLWPHEPQHASLPVHHQLPESTQTHVHCVGDAIQPSHPLSSPSPSALNLSQHRGLFKWVSSLHQVAKVLEFQLQHQSFQWTPIVMSNSLRPHGLQDCRPPGSSAHGILQAQIL